jgi:hypothetical protein
MSTYDFYEKSRQLLDNMLNETAKADREQVINAYAEALTQLHAAETHKTLHALLDDARTRLDAELSPDPVRQTIANVQTTMQDLWRSLWD